LRLLACPGALLIGYRKRIAKAATSRPGQSGKPPAANSLMRKIISADRPVRRGVAGHHGRRQSRMRLARSPQVRLMWNDDLDTPFGSRSLRPLRLSRWPHPGDISVPDPFGAEIDSKVPEIARYDAFMLLDQSNAQPQAAAVAQPVRLRRPVRRLQRPHHGLGRHCGRARQ